jgi:transcriptional regulator with XRE-family HTH domain
MLFGEMVATARKNSSLSLRELSAQTGISTSTLSKIESKGHIPGDSIILRLIQVLHLSERIVKARITRQREIRNSEEAPPPENTPMLSPVPIVGKVSGEN